MGILLLPRLGSEVAEADVAGMEPWSLHPAVLSTRGGKQAGLPEVAWHPCEPALPNLLLPGSWSGQAGTGPLPFSQLLNQGPSQKVGIFTLNKAQSPPSPPSRKTTGFHRESGDWQSPFPQRALGLYRSSTWTLGHSPEKQLPLDGCLSLCMSGILEAERRKRGL